ncbi:MAG: hypothetical protein AMJ46_11915 [Latescibacteria bacterium DG_63]|nr:MAG: hypothetical protein AMJ46_11915 [Latescibacteria bacterium DG_63]
MTDREKMTDKEKMADRKKTTDKKRITERKMSYPQTITRNKKTVDAKRISRNKTTLDADATNNQSAKIHVTQADCSFLDTKGRDEHCFRVRHAAGPSHLLSRALGVCRTLPTVLPVLVAVLAAFALACVPTYVAEGAAVIHDAESVLSDYTHELGGKLYFDSPTGQSWELITDINDPEILNKGDWSFHPFPAEEIEEALQQVSYEHNEIPFEVFVLPYPLRGLVESFASPGKVFLSPGVREHLAQHVHFTIVHELGHIIHRHFMPDDNGPLWQRYRELRGITNTSIYNNAAVHKNRPHEIFAEDFRFLFGGAIANYSGSIENPSLPLPTQVPGLREFFLSLPVEAKKAATLRIASFPNPFNPVLNIKFSVGVDQVGQRATLRIFDVQGRLVRTLLDSELSEGNHSAVWSGTDERGKTVTSGIYFLRLEVGQQSVVEKVILSR